MLNYTYLDLLVHTLTYIYVLTHVLTRIPTCTYTYKHLNVLTYTCTYMHMYLGLHLHLHVYLHIHLLRFTRAFTCVLTNFKAEFQVPGFVSVLQLGGTLAHLILDMGTVG